MMDIAKEQIGKIQAPNEWITSSEAKEAYTYIPELPEGEEYPSLGTMSDKPVKDIKLLIKLFLPSSRWTWYISELGALDEESGDVLFFGYVVSGLDPTFDEWGYFTLSQIKEVRSNGFAPLPVERDIYFKPKTFAEEFKND